MGVVPVCACRRSLEAVNEAGTRLDRLQTQARDTVRPGRTLLATQRLESAVPARRKFIYVRYPMEVHRRILRQVVANGYLQALLAQGT